MVAYRWGRCKQREARKRAAAFRSGSRRRGTPGKERNHADSDLVQVLGQSGVLAAGGEELKIGFLPAFGFTVWVAASERVEHAFRTSLGRYLLGGESFRLLTGVEAELAPEVCQPIAFLIILRIETGQHPAFSFGVRHSNHDRRIELGVSSRLIEPFTPVNVTIIIAEEENGVGRAIACVKQPQGFPGSVSIGLGWLSTEALNRNQARACQASHRCPAEILIGGLQTAPLPLTAEHVGFKPGYRLTHNAIRQIAAGAQVGGGLANHSNRDRHYCRAPASVSTSHFSPNRLHISPGVISCFHFSNCGWSSSRPHTTEPSSLSAVRRTSSGWR